MDEISVTAKLAQVLFEAYSAQKGGLTYDGKPIPAWADVGEEVQAGWRAAARAAQDQLRVVVDDREFLQIEHARDYATNYSSAGIPGHGQLLLIAKLAAAVRVVLK